MQCSGFGQTCIIDMAGAPHPVFSVSNNGALTVNNIRIINGATTGNGAAVQVRRGGAGRLLRLLEGEGFLSLGHPKCLPPSCPPACCLPADNCGKKDCVQQLRLHRQHGGRRRGRQAL